MKSRNSFLIAGGAVALVLTGPRLLAAQPAPSASTAGFIGQTYSGVEWGYTRHRESAPSVLHRYGFVSSRPILELEAKNVDGAFHYNYTRGSTLGADGSQHDFTAGFTGYLSRGDMTPFLEGRAGWAWAKASAVRRNSFTYLVGAGVEMQLAPQLSVTPYVNYGEAPRFHNRAWGGGVKAGFRMNQGWSSSVAVEANDGHNIEFSLGVQRRY